MGDGRDIGNVSLPVYLVFIAFISRNACSDVVASELMSFTNPKNPFPNPLPWPRCATCVMAATTHFVDIFYIVISPSGIARDASDFNSFVSLFIF